MKKLLNLIIKKSIEQGKKLEQRFSNKLFYILCSLAIVFFIIICFGKYYLYPSSDTFEPLEMAAANVPQTEQTEQTEEGTDENNEINPFNILESTNNTKQDDNNRFANNNTKENVEDFDENEGILPEEAENLIASIVQAAQQLYAEDKTRKFDYIVKKEDTFNSILNQFDLTKNKDFIELLKKYPEAKKVNINDLWEISINNQTNELVEFKITTSKYREILYLKNEQGQINKKEVKSIVTYGDDTIYTGVMTNNLAESLTQAGVPSSNTVAMNIINAFNATDINFRQISSGGSFILIFSNKYINEEKTTPELKAAALKLNGKVYYSMLASNGGYYNEQGNNSSKNELINKTYKVVNGKAAVWQEASGQKPKYQQFLKFPMIKTYRITSRFNPRRLHPVTGRITPHNGVDFGMPTGTPILASADGSVVRVASQPRGAGLYIVLTHGAGKYQTVYMHLSKALVKAGEKVKRGQVIAKSGSTGRVTGAHLHYEIRVDGKPVNPMIQGAKIAFIENGRLTYKTVKKSVPIYSKMQLTLNDEDKKQFLEDFNALKPTLENILQDFNVFKPTLEKIEQD